MNDTMNAGQNKVGRARLIIAIVLFLGAGFNLLVGTDVVLRSDRTEELSRAREERARAMHDFGPMAVERELRADADIRRLEGPNDFRSQGIAHLAGGGVLFIVSGWLLTSWICKRKAASVVSVGMPVVA